MAATAWYIIPSQLRWVRWFNVLHWPYSLWHLSYPAMGAALAEDLSWPLVGWTLLAFFLGMGVAAHCFDLFKGDPLGLSLPRIQLAAVGFGALGLAASLGLWQWAVGNVPSITLYLWPWESCLLSAITWSGLVFTAIGSSPPGGRCSPSWWATSPRAYISIWSSCLR